MDLLNTQLHDYTCLTTGTGRGNRSSTCVSSFPLGARMPKESSDILLGHFLFILYLMKKEAQHQVSVDFNDTTSFYSTNNAFFFFCFFYSIILLYQ